MNELYQVGQREVQSGWALRNSQYQVHSYVQFSSVASAIQVAMLERKNKKKIRGISLQTLASDNISQSFFLFRVKGADN